MTPVCHHGGRFWDSEKPFCDDPQCHHAWWVRYGMPFLALIVGLLVLGMLLGPGGGYGYSGWS